jgi:alpha-glucosidase
MPNLNGQSSGHDWTGDSHPHWDLDEVHDVYRAWRQVADEYAPERTFVAEAWVTKPERLARYLRPGELHTAFNFGFLVAEWDADAIRKAIVDSVAALGEVGAPATWVLSNHDVHRHVTRYGGGRLGTRRARAAALLMLALPGGAYVYQGEELGLPEVEDLADAARRDPVFSRTGGRQKGRDGSRIPLPWSGGAPPYGFGPAPAGTQPWLPQPDGWGAFSVERQAADPGSMLALYRQALRLRHELAALGDGTMAWLEGGPDLLAFTRAPGFACVVNFGATPADPPAEVRGARLLLASAPIRADGRLPGDSAAWYAPHA